MIDGLKNAYAELKASYMRERGYGVPARYQSAFVHWGGGCETQYIFDLFAHGIPERGGVLIIGAMGGRDYWWFRNQGYRVTPVDLGPQPEIPDLVLADVQERLPFPDACFDLVVLSEVLEHLGADLQALANVRRVLKDDGRLIVSLPFYNDWEEGHMRIHSPRSARRLLAMGGFEVARQLERPGLIRPGRLINCLQHGLSWLCRRLTGRTAYLTFTSGFGRLEAALGAIALFRPLRRRSRHFGGYFLCHKAPAWDTVALNRQLYTS